MKRVFIAIGIVLLFPLALVTLLYIVCKFQQPKTLPLASTQRYEGTSYFDERNKYLLGGDMLCFPNQVLVPEGFEDYYEKSAKYSGSILDNKDYSSCVISSYDSIPRKECLNDGDYIATIAFFSKFPAMADFAIWFPDEYCEYRVFVNGHLAASSRTFGEKTPSFPKPFIATIPSNYDGNYEIVINIISPVGYKNNGSTALMIGSKSHIEAAFKLDTYAGAFLFAFILFTIIFVVVQFVAVRSDRRMIPFIFLSLATMLIMSFMDTRTIITLVPSLPYNVGVFLENIATPLFLVALLVFTRSMFPDYFPLKVSILFLVLQLLPLFNAFTLGKYNLDTICTFISAIPYAICLYVFVLVFERQEPHALSYGIALLSIESSVLLYYATSDLPIPSKFAYSGGYVILSVIIVSIFAKEYATQNTNEQFYSNELSRQLEAMQASENAFLNAQMKPHFLYNTLNTIADCCVTDSEKAKKLINSLSEYLKLILSLDNMQKVVSIEHELELAEAYTVIEKERFPNINFYNELPLKLPKLTMPPITLQPLIENAIKHGVRKLDKPGVITLRIIDNENFVEFIVSDNGVGMEKETIEKLFKVPNGNQSIGIYNINKRLKSLYGKGLQVESTPGMGTSISFIVPKKN